VITDRKAPQTRSESDQEAAQLSLCGRTAACAGPSSKFIRRSRLGLIATLQGEGMRARVFKTLYLTALGVAMIGWLWMLVDVFIRIV